MKKYKKYIIIICIIAIVTISFLNPKIKATRNLTEFERAFKEVAYAYYMRGTALQYNVAKGTVKSPEESTSQDNNYLACAFYVMNVYKELLGIDLCHNDKAYCNYAKDFVGKRQEVIGYGHLENNGDLYWYDGSKNDKGELNIIKNPTQDYIISKLKIGDIIDYAGHVMLVYDYVYDNNGNIVDVYLLNSTVTGYYYTRTKSDCISSSLYYYDKDGKKNSLPTTYSPWSKLFYINHDMTGIFEESKIEGTVQLETLKYRADNINASLLFDKSNPKNKYANNYGILRFVTTDEEGNDLLNFDGTYSLFNGTTANNKKIEYSDSVKSRIDYSKLYIEKTVDKRDNNAVLVNDELNYKLVLRNNSKEKYNKDLVVKENLSDYVDYISFESNKTIVDFQKNDGQLVWNLGKLNSGEEVIITYKVKVKPGYAGKIIESTGTVDNIPSGTVKNKIEVGIEAKKDVLETFERLKKTYSGRKLINEVYKEAYGIDIGLEDFNMLASEKDSNDGLIYSNKKWGNLSNFNNDSYLAISKNNKFSSMILNGYFNVQWKDDLIRKSINDVNIYVHSLISWGQEKNNPDNREDTIYPEDFKTGDILIYNNKNDKSYYYSSGNETEIKEWAVTHENGEYCYIYVEGTGFIGINTGSDEVASNDDRNEFNSKYFDTKKITMYIKGSNDVRLEMTDEIKEWMSYQSLFGKDSYVILRPSLEKELIPMDLDVNYSTTEKTNRDVVVNITSNVKMLNVDGWILSEDGKKLTKTYTKNGEETITIYDLAGNSIVKEIKVGNIDKEKPTIKGVADGKNYKTSVNPIVEDNDELSEVILLKNENKTDKYKVGDTISEIGKYTLIAKDSAGNEIKVSFTILDTTDPDPTEEKFYSDKYHIDNDGKIIDKIEDTTTVDGFKENIESTLSYEIKDKNGNSLSNNDYIGTGCMVVTENDEYKIIIRGDVNGDGKIDFIDILNVNKHRLNKQQLQDEYLLAGDIDENNNITFNDILQMNKKRLIKQ